MSLLVETAIEEGCPACGGDVTLEGREDGEIALTCDCGSVVALA